MRAVLVPVKAFHQAKLRLAGALSPAERRALAQTLAERVLAAASGLPVFVACDDQAVAKWAVTRGAEVLWTPGLGLSGAVRSGVTSLAERGVDLAVVSHSDLPLVTTFEGIGAEDEITLVPDRRLDGTNVVCVPTRADFNFAYGLGSFRRHLAEADRSGVTTRVLYDWNLANDLDVPDDLVLMH